MRRYRIGSAFGIPVKLDVTFLLILPVFAALIGWRIGETAELFNDYFGAGLAVEALTGPIAPWLLGTIAAVGLFAGVLAHEFGHALVAIRYGYGIDSITLWIFGGLASLAEMPENWRHEFLIAVAGPIVSVLVGLASYGLYLLVPETVSHARYVLLYLAVLNVALAGFNMLPAFPMDGGRVLRALLGRTRSFADATRIAAEVGKLFAILLGILGLFQFNVILIGIALFVYIAASGEQKQVAARAALEGITVEEVMTPASALQAVSPDLTVDGLLQRMYEQRQTAYPVVRSGRPIGIVTLDDAREVPQVKRHAVVVGDVMSGDPATVRPDTEAVDVLGIFRNEGVGQLLVVDRRGGVVGLLSETDLATAIGVVKSGGSVTDDHGPQPTRRY